MHGAVKILMQDGQPVDVALTPADAALLVRERLEAWEQQFKVANPWDAPVMPPRLAAVRYRKFYRT